MANEMPWWAVDRPEDQYSVNHLDRQSLLGTTTDRRNSWFYYDTDNKLAETADFNQFTDESNGLFDVIQNDYRQFPIERASGFADPWKQNNIMDVFSSTIDQAMDYEGVDPTDVTGRQSIREYYGFDRPAEWSVMAEQLSSTSKLLLSSQDQSGSYRGTFDSYGPLSGFLASNGTPIQPGDASALDYPLLFKQYSSTKNLDGITKSVDAMYSLEARSSRMYREIGRFDADFNPTKAWSNLSETQRKFLESEGYNPESWMSSGTEKANNALDYFVRTEKFIRDRVYAQQLENFANKSSVIGYSVNSLSSWAVNSFANDMDNLIFTGVTAPAGGWSSKGIQVGIKTGMAGALERLGLAIPAGVKSTLIEGAILGAGQEVGAAQASTDLANIFNIGDDIEEPSYSESILRGAMFGAAFVSGMHYLPGVIKGLSLKGIDLLPLKAQNKIYNTPLIGSKLLTAQSYDSLRKIFGAVGEDADQFYLYDYLTPNQAALLMHDEAMGRGMIMRTLTSMYGTDSKILNKFDRFLSRDYLHSHNTNFAQLGDRIAMVAAEMDENLLASPDTLASYLDGVVEMQSKLGAKDIVEFRKTRAVELEGQVNENLGDIRYNEAKILSKRERKTLEELRSKELVPGQKETPAMFENREWKHKITLASYLARSEMATDLQKALDILSEAKDKKLLPAWGRKVIKRLQRSVDDVSAKSSLERRIIRLERMASIVEDERGVRYRDIKDAPLSTKSFIEGLRDYRKKIRKDPPKGYEGKAEEYRAIVREEYKKNLEMLKTVKDEMLFEHRGRGEFEGDLKSFDKEYQERLKAENPDLSIDALLAESSVEKSAAHQFLEALNDVRKARKERDAAIARANKEGDLGKRAALRDEAIKTYTDFKTKRLTQFAEVQADEIDSITKAAVKRQVSGFNSLPSGTRQEILDRLFQTLSSLGEEPGHAANTVIRMWDNTPYLDRFKLLMSQIATWPQAQRNSFLNHVSAIRGLAVLHDDSPSFANTFRSLGNPTSLRAASYAAVADALPVIQIGIRIKDRYGMGVKAQMNTHLIEFRQAGKKFTLENLPESLKGFGEQIVKDLNEWNDATTAYFTNVLTAGHEVGLIRNGINPERYVPHRLPGDMADMAIDRFVEKFVNLRKAQFTDETPLDLTTLEARGYIVRTEDGESFVIPESSPFRFLGQNVDDQIDALKKLVSKGTKGLVELQRLQPVEIPEKLMEKRPARSHGSNGELLYAPRTKDPNLAYDSTELISRLSPQSSLDDLVGLYWDVSDGLYDGALTTESSKIKFINRWNKLVVKSAFGGDYWYKSAADAVVSDAGEFAKLSPLHDHVQRMWQRFGVMDEDQQQILRAAYAHVPQSVIGIRVLNSQNNEWGFANPASMSIESPGITEATMFLHETGHFVLFKNQSIVNAMDSILKNLSTEDTMTLLKLSGITQPNQIGYAMLNPDELGAVLWDAYMTRNASARRITRSAKANWAYKALWSIFNRIRDWFPKRQSIEELGDHIFKTFDEMSEASIARLQKKIDGYKPVESYEYSDIDRRLFEYVYGYGASPDKLRVWFDLMYRTKDDENIDIKSHGDATALESIAASLVGFDRIKKSTGPEEIAMNLQSIMKVRLDPTLFSILEDAGRTRTMGQIMDTLHMWGGLYDVNRYFNEFSDRDSFASRAPSVRRWIESESTTLLDVMKKAQNAVYKRYKDKGVSRDDAYDLVSNAYLALISDRENELPAIEEALVPNDQGRLDPEKTRAKLESFLVDRAYKAQLNVFRDSGRRKEILKNVAMVKGEAAPDEFTPLQKAEARQNTQKALVATAQELAEKDKATKRVPKEKTPVTGPVTIPELLSEAIGKSGIKIVKRAVKEDDYEAVARIVAAAEQEIDAVAPSKKTKAPKTKKETSATAPEKPAEAPPEPPKTPPTDIQFGGLDPEWFFKKKQFFKKMKERFVKIRDHWSVVGVLDPRWKDVDLAADYRDAFRSPVNYTEAFKLLHKNKTGLQVAAERYVDKMTNRSLGRGSATDMRDIREAVRRNSRPDSIEGEDRVFSDADFSTPEGQALSREFGLLNDLDSLIKDYAKSSGTRINAQAMLQATLKNHLGVENMWDGSGLTYGDMYDAFEDSLGRMLATNADGSVRSLTQDEKEMVTHVSDQFREKYLRMINKFPSQDQDTTFNKTTQIVRNLTLNILGPVASPTIMAVEMPIAIARSVGLDPKGAIRHGTALLEHTIGSTVGKIFGKKMTNEMLEDMIFFVEGLDSSPLGRLTGERELVGNGHSIATTTWERFRQNIKKTADTLKGDRSANRALDFLVSATQTTSQLAADVAGMRWATDMTRFMGVRQAKREIIRFLPNLKKLRENWDEAKILLAKDDNARIEIIKGWTREAGVPYYVWNRASRKGLLLPGMIENIETMFPDMLWGRNGARGHELNLNAARSRLLGLDQEASLGSLDRKGSSGAIERRQALTGLHSYLEEGVNWYSPELRGIYRLDRQDQLTPWKRLLFFWQNYPMAFYNVSIQQAFRNQRVPMALGNVAGLFVLEIQARMARDVLLADDEEKRKNAIQRWKSFVSLDPTHVGSELLQGMPMIPLLGHSQWLLSDITVPVVNGFLPKDSRVKFFPKTFGSSPVMGVTNRIYRSFISNPLKGISEFVDKGSTKGLNKAATDMGNLMLDTIPGVNSWGRAAWNLGNAAFAKEATSSPWGASMPASMGTWAEAFMVDHIAKKAYKPNTGVPAKVVPTVPQSQGMDPKGIQGTTDEPMKLIEESLRKPIGRIR
jgi:hypothetical protein